MKKNIPLPCSIIIFIWTGIIMADEKTPLLKSDSYKSNNGVKQQDKQQPGGCVAFLKSTNFLLYCSHTLSAWGDRMWQFAVGMFLVELSPDSLRLTATYGFASGAAILLFGAIVGNWVDKNERLKVARTSIIVQNLCVTISAVAVCLNLYFEDYVKSTWDGWLETVVHIVVVLFAVICDVASVGRTISIERDWIVVICKDTPSLTSMSARLRRIDLTTNLLAPIITGQLITYASMFIAAIFIAAWNIVSMIVEYVLLYFVYKSVPELAIKKLDTEPEDAEESEPLMYKNGSLTESGKHQISSSGNHTKPVPSTSKATACFNMFCGDFIVLAKGWRAYSKQKILYAGIALSALYMTVLGFDNITTGYAKEQGLSESIISILLAAGAGVGILGTVAFPFFRQKLGLQRTGLFAFGFEVMCLILCVLSVFAPGSPFDPYYLMKSDSGYHEELGNLTDILMTTEYTPTFEGKQYMAVILLMAGIVSSRFGLWMADLTITQLLLETPDESERGIVNGVQSSLNKLTDIIKFILVITLPWNETFGYLIIASFACVCLGWLLFAIYSRQVRGHLFHFGDRFDDIKKRRGLDNPELRHSTADENC